LILDHVKTMWKAPTSQYVSKTTTWTTFRLSMARTRESVCFGRWAWSAPKVDRSSEMTWKRVKRAILRLCCFWMQWEGRHHIPSTKDIGRTTATRAGKMTCPMRTVRDGRSPDHANRRTDGGGGDFDTGKVTRMFWTRNTDVSGTGPAGTLRSLLVRLGTPIADDANPDLPI
jgi:hypothetical protein